MKGCDMTRGEVSKGVLAQANKYFGPNVKETDSLELDLALDSLDKIELLVEIEIAFGVDIDNEEAKQVRTIADIINIIEKEANKC